MPKNTKTILIATAVLSVVSIASYLNFSGYKPKAIKQVEEVRGIHDEVSSELPLPENVKKVGTSKSSNATQITFHTEKTKDEIQDFYKNIFKKDVWTLDSQNVQESFIITKYHSKEKNVSVTTLNTQEENDTLVSLEVSNK